MFNYNFKCHSYSWKWHQKINKFADFTSLRNTTHLTVSYPEVMSGWLCQRINYVPWSVQLCHFFFLNSVNFSKSSWLTGKNFCTDIHDSQRMNQNDSLDLVMFPWLSPWGWHLWFCVKSLDNYGQDCLEIFFTHSCSPSGWIVRTFSCSVIIDLCPQILHVLAEQPPQRRCRVKLKVPHLQVWLRSALGPVTPGLLFD